MGHAAKRPQTEGKPVRAWNMQGPHSPAQNGSSRRRRMPGSTYRNTKTRRRARHSKQLVIPASEAAAPTETDAVVARLRAMDPIASDQCRKEEARRLGIRPIALDKAVKAAQAAVSDGGGNKQGSPARARGSGAVARAGEMALTCSGGVAAVLCQFPRAAQRRLPTFSRCGGVHTHCYRSSHDTRQGWRSAAQTSSAAKDDRAGPVADRGAVRTSCPSRRAFTNRGPILDGKACAPTLLVGQGNTSLGRKRGPPRRARRGDAERGRPGHSLRRGRCRTTHLRCFCSRRYRFHRARFPGTIADRSVRHRHAARDAGGAAPAHPRRHRTRLEQILARKATRWAARAMPQSLHDQNPALPDGMANRTADNCRTLPRHPWVAGGAGARDLKSRRRGVGDFDDGREGLGVALLRDVRTIFTETRSPEATLATAESWCID